MQLWKNHGLSGFTACWENKGKTQNNNVDFIPWCTIGKALQGMPKAKKWFITKQTVGMCGVGKWMRRWRQWHNHDCPRCGQPEDAAHGLLCKGANSEQV
jgi:hypothetical protein